jgi:hypothetical protein
MKATELMSELEALVAKHGDHDVGVLWSDVHEIFKPLSAVHMNGKHNAFTLRVACGKMVEMEKIDATTWIIHDQGLT